MLPTVTTEEFLREGRQVDAEMRALNEAVDRTMAKAHVFPDGPWWQRWEGFFGGWTQYFDQQIRPVPVMPFHDDGDIKQWAKDLDVWKADFAKGQTQNVTRELGGPLTPTTQGGASSLPTAVKFLAVIAGLGVGGYFLSSAGSFKRSFT